MNLRPTPFVLALCIGSVAIATVQSDEFSVPNTFTPGTPARADEVNENFAAVGDEVNGMHLLIADATARLDALPDVIDPENLLVVAKSGGHFTSIAAALATTDDASEDNPYAVFVAPGVYTESEVSEVRGFVHLFGAGRGVSVLSTSRSAATQGDSASAVRLLSGGSVSNLTVRNTSAGGTFTIGILGFELDRSTRVRETEVVAEGTSGVGHFAMLVHDSNLIVEDTSLRAAGASSVNSAFGSVDSGGPFAQPTIRGCELRGEGVNSGFGMQVSSTAADVFDSEVYGDFRAISAAIAGITELQNVKLDTLGLNPWAEQTGSASLLSAHCYFVAGNAIGLASQFKFVWCVKSNYDPIVNGTGSSIQP